MKDTITLDGLRFKVTIAHDSDMGEPWKEYDCYGIVSEWTQRDKKPGERVLVSHRESRRYYDVAESIKVALRDGWGCANPEGKTRRQIASEAVEQDYQRLRAWCNDEWFWVYVEVQLIDVNGVPVPGYRESLAGIESDSEEYIGEVAMDLAGEISARVGNAGKVCLQVR